MSIFRKIKFKAFGSLMTLLFNLRERYSHVPISAPVLSEDVKRALDIDASGVILEISRCLSDRIMLDRLPDGLSQNKELFYLNGNPLPCVMDSDYNFHDNWLTAANYYPLYFNLYSQLFANADHVRMLEIGVRTGYQGVVFAKARRNKSKAFFMGIDPNLYVSDGLQRAHKSLQIMREISSQFDFALIEGYSWEWNVQKSALYSGPFDIVHIDGDHSLEGKLIDLELSRRLLSPGGLVLVDDFDHHPIIKEAVKRSMVVGWFKEFAYVSTLRGLAILR